MDTNTTLPQVYWRLREVMTERGVPSVAALRRRLKDHYPFISEVQLGRIVGQLPERLNMALLIALCHALECSPSDLLYWGACSQPVSTGRPNRRPKSPRELPAEEIARLKGPVFTVFAVPPKEDTP